MLECERKGCLEITYGKTTFLGVLSAQVCVPCVNWIDAHPGMSENLARCSEARMEYTLAIAAVGAGQGTKDEARERFREMAKAHDVARAFVRDLISTPKDKTP